LFSGNISKFSQFLKKKIQKIFQEFFLIVSEKGQNISENFLIVSGESSRTKSESFSGKLLKVSENTI
jgi:hypothetical protein